MLWRLMMRGSTVHTSLYNLCIPKGLQSVEKPREQSATYHDRHTQRFLVSLSVSGAPKSKILKIESFKAEIRILVKILITFILRLN